MQISELEWLEKFYLECCNGDWEHTYGIKIDTLDNPGWSLDIDLIDTNLEDFSFEPIQKERSEHDWFFCMVKDKKFQGRGGVNNLKEIISSFRHWVKECDNKASLPERSGISI